MQWNDDDSAKFASIGADKIDKNDIAADETDIKNKENLLTAR